jgi:tetratricopeptide (TPR) repeat protein
MMVNFHALANYFKNAGGDAFLQTPRRGIKTSIFTSLPSLQDLPQTNTAIQRYVEGLSAADYFTLHRRVSDSFQECSLDTLASHMTFAGWDPHMYLKLSNRIVSLIPDSDKETVEYFASKMHKLAENYYYMPKSECIYFEIGVFFHALKRFEEALKYYLMAVEFVGEQFSLFFNIGLCQQNIGHTDEALEYFKKAHQLNPESKEASEWIDYIENKS